MGTGKFDGFFERVSQAAGLESQQELAALLGVNRSAISQAKRRDSIPQKWLLMLSRTLGIDPDWLETGEVSKHVNTPNVFGSGGHEDINFATVAKVRARLSAGGGSFDASTQVEGYYAFHRSWLESKGKVDTMVLMDVMGNSMEPELREGDTVLIDQSNKDILAGSIYAMGVEDTVMVKRVEKRPGGLALLSDNTDYDPIVLRGDEMATVRVIGKMVWSCREYR